MGMAERIKERRLVMEYTQEELAEKLGLQKSAIAKYENGRVENIKRSIISKMADILHCSPAYLMGWTDDIVNDKLSENNTTLAAKVAKRPELKALISFYESTNDIGKKRIMETAADMAKLYPNE